jgi:DNA-binding NarL/FixJ family response regulator
MILREAPMPTLRVFVVDDHPVVREIICSLLSQEPALRVVCQTADGEEAVEKADELRPDIVVLDIGLPGITGIEGSASNT